MFTIRAYYDTTPDAYSVDNGPFVYAEQADKAAIEMLKKPAVQAVRIIEHDFREVEPTNDQ